MCFEKELQSQMPENHMNSDAFLEVEKKYDLYNLKCNGINYWVYIRFFLWNHIICSEVLGLNANSVSRNNDVSFGDRMRYLLHSNKCPNNVDILFYNHERRLKVSNYFECIYTEELSRKFKSTVTVERPFNGKHLQPVKTKNLIYIDKIKKCVAIKRRVYKIINRKKYIDMWTTIQAQINPALSDIKLAYGCEFDDNTLIRDLVEYAVSIPYEKILLKKLIKRISPKLIVVVVSYVNDKMVFIEAAKELGIPVIELQHGTIHEDHIAYKYAEGVKVKQFPDWLFLFSDYWKGRIQAPISENNIVSVGFPYFEKQIKEYKDIKRTDGRFTILFISQITVGSYLSKLAIDLCQSLPNSDFRIIFKLHPAEVNNWKTIYPGLDNPGIEVISGNEKSIYYYFSQSNMQVGVYSTAIFEGLAFNLTTLILKVGHYYVMNDLVQLGYATFINSAKDVLDYLSRYNNDIDFNNFWKTYSLDNMVRQIKNIIPNVITNTAFEESE